MIKLVANGVHPNKIPFSNDPLTLILKDSIVGNNAYARMFVNISPSKWDTAVTNRSLKFALQTGMANTNDVDKFALQELEKKAEER